MANYFEKVKRFADVDITLPVRKTKNSAGYDFEVAEDTLIPAYVNKPYDMPNTTCSLRAITDLTKKAGIRPILVPTGIKCHLDPGYYLELSVRSSTPLKYLLMMANGIGIIDADYYGNADNDGEIFFQLLNFSPYPILLQQGDIIGQGIIKKYEVTTDDAATGERKGGFGSTSNE